MEDSSAESYFVLKIFYNDTKLTKIIKKYLLQKNKNKIKSQKNYSILKNVTYLLVFIASFKHHYKIINEINMTKIIIFQENQKNYF